MISTPQTQQTQLTKQTQLFPIPLTGRHVPCNPILMKDTMLYMILHLREALRLFFGPSIFQSSYYS